MLLKLIKKISRPDVVAFLVDGDNVSHNLIREFINEAKQLGRVSIRRVYSHNTQTSGGSYKSSPYADNGVTPIHVPNVTKRKNAADLILTMDAIELAMSKEVDVICIASDDSDFTFLAHRLRELGVKVYGFGTKKSPTVWQNACDGFYVKGTGVVKSGEAVRSGSIEGVEMEIRDFLSTRKSETIQLSTVGSHLMSLDPTFTPKRYGFKNLMKLANSLSGIKTYTIGENDIGVRMEG